MAVAEGSSHSQASGCEPCQDAVTRMLHVLISHDYPCFTALHELLTMADHGSANDISSFFYLFSLKPEAKMSHKKTPGRGSAVSCLVVLDKIVHVT